MLKNRLLFILLIELFKKLSYSLYSKNFEWAFSLMLLHDN